MTHFIILFINKAHCFAQTSARHSTKIQEHLAMWLRQERLDLLKVWIARLSDACRYVSVRRVGMWWDDWLQPVLATTLALWQILTKNDFIINLNYRLSQWFLTWDVHPTGVNLIFTGDW